MQTTNPLEEDILRALRRITRSIDLHSRQLTSQFGLTAPQLVCLRTIQTKGRISPSELAHEVALSQATITGIIDRLSGRQLVTRSRASKDRRVVTVELTEAGKKLVEEAPSPLQEKLSQRLRKLPDTQQEAIRDTLMKLVRMMDGENIDAEPILGSSVVEQLIPLVSEKP